MSPSDDPSQTRLDELNDNHGTGSEFLDRSSNLQVATVDLEKLAAALQRGATLYIGPDESFLDLGGLQKLLRDTFLFDDSYRRDKLIGPTAICAHWFQFTGQRCGLNHKYPAASLRELIRACFGLDYFDIPMDAVLAGLRHRGFEVQRIKPGLASFNWAADIRSVTYRPGGTKLVRITELGKRGAIPPIRILE